MWVIALVFFMVVCLELRLRGPFVIYVDEFGILNRIAGMRLAGIAWFWPTIMVRKSASSALDVEHEKIHFNHQCEMFVIPFFILYGAFYGYLRLIKRYSAHKAYMSNPFERAAYSLDKRPYSWVFYMGPE